MKKINFSFRNLRSDIFVGIIIGCLILLNFLTQHISLRLDLSRNKANTLASASRQIARNLTKDVHIYYFASQTLPTKFLPLKQAVSDTLKLYKSTSSKLVLHLLDPTTNLDAQKKAQEYGMRELEFSQADANTFAVAKGYFGIVLVSGDKKEYITDPTDLENLEYNLTLALYRIDRTILPKVQIAEGGASMQLFQRLAQQQYTIEPLQETIAKDTKAIILFDNPEATYTPEKIADIRNYVQKGGKVLAFVDGVSVSAMNPGNIQAATHSAHLKLLLQDFNIRVAQQLVLSAAAEIIQVDQQVLLPYPLWLKTNAYNVKSPLFQSISYVLFQWASPVIGGETLIRSLPQSWTQTQNFILNPQDVLQNKPAKLETSPLVSSGKNKSGGELVVIGTTKFIDDRYLPPQAGNHAFVLAVLDQFTTRGELSGIRARAQSLYPIPPVSPLTAELIKWGVTLIPAVFLLYGVWFTTRRA